MIYFYDGVPGSGKSLHLAMTITEWLLTGKNAICANLKIDYDAVLQIAKERNISNVGSLICVPRDEFLNNSITVVGTKKKEEFSYIKGLYGYAENFHQYNEKGQFIEYQTLLVIDECQDYFDSRRWNRADRLPWASFFQMHRHYGFQVVLCSQTDSAIDKRIVALLQTKVSHRDYMYHKGFWKFVAKIKGGHLFWVGEYNYQIKDKKERVLGFYFLRGYEEYYSVYDSFSVETHIPGKEKNIPKPQEQLDKDLAWEECTRALYCGEYLTQSSLHTV